MTGAERFVIALRGGTPDRVPIFDFLDSNAFIQRVIGKRPEFYLARDVVEATLACGLWTGRSSATAAPRRLRSEKTATGTSGEPCGRRPVSPGRQMLPSTTR
jgi:hypothetical protein